jgi:hypothetical protein
MPIGIAAFRFVLLTDSMCHCWLKPISAASSTNIIATKERKAIRTQNEHKNLSLSRVSEEGYFVMQPRANTCHVGRST